MATDKANIDNDEIRLDVNESNNEQEELVNDAVSENATAQKQNGNSRVKKVAAGIAGVAAGVGGMMPLTSFKEPEEPVSNPDPQAEPIPEPPLFDGEEVLVAYGVNDNMSFSEAFATARREVGPGGVFQWHGHVYGTYYAEEWQDFSDEYKQAFSNYHYDNLPDTQYEEVVTVEAKVANDFAYIHEVPEGYDDVAIVNTEHIEFDREAVAVVSTNMDEQEMVFVDTDLDSNYDVAVVSDAGDFENPAVYLDDDDGIIAYDAPDFDMSGEHWADFHNDADISNYV